METEIEELKAICPEVFVNSEAGVTYYLLKDLRLPDGCSPNVVDALLRPTRGGDGYPTRLFFSAMIITKKPLNWNAKEVRIFDRNWYAYSWELKVPGQRLAQILANHIKALQ